jgi:hypothetical protein
MPSDIVEISEPERSPHYVKCLGVGVSGDASTRWTRTAADVPTIHC